MEDLKRTMRKKTSAKQPKPQPQNLYNQCDSELGKLNKQLYAYFQNQREKKISAVMPSLDHLQGEIMQLKENISHEATPEEKISEKVKLVLAKEKLQIRLQGRAKEIENMKKKLRQLNIDHDELVRQYEENKIALDKPQSGQEQVGEEKVTESYTEILSQRQSIHSDIREMSNSQFDRKLPSLFNPSRKLHTLSTLNPKILQDSDSKQSKIDKLLHKMTNLNSDALAAKLLNLGRIEKGGIKSLMKNYQVSDRIGQFLQNKEIHEELKKLESKLR